MVKLKKRTLWSSKNSVSHKPLKQKRRPRHEYNSHSPRKEEKHVYFEYGTPAKDNRLKLGQTQDFSPNRFQHSSYSALSNFTSTMSESKRMPKEFRIQRSFRGKVTKTKNRPPLYAGLHGGKSNDISTKLLR